MTGLLGGSWSPIGWVVSFIAAPHATVLAADQSWRHGLGQTFEVSEPTRFPDCLALLEPLESPWTRELLIDCGPWTAYLNNNKNGGDPTSAAMYLARRVGTRCVIAMNSPPHGPGHGGTQLWLTGPDGEPPLMYERTVAAVAEDGLWSWSESGQPQTFEDLTRYQARRIKDRFNRELLITYLNLLAIHPDDSNWFGDGVLLHREVDFATNPETIEEAARRLQIVIE